MPRDLFQDLGARRSNAGGWRALPASLALHALAAGAVALFVVRPVANAIEDPPTGMLRILGGTPTPAPAAPRIPPTQRPRRRTGADGGAPAPASIPIVTPEYRTPVNGEADDMPAPCLTGCGDGPPGSTGVGPGAGPGDGGLDVAAGDGSPLPIGGALRPPRKTQHVLPAYPALAQRAGIGAIVIVQCVIDVDGRVSDAHVLRGHPLLDAAALEAMRQWRYEPTRLNGIAVPVVMTVTVTFQAQR